MLACQWLPALDKFCEWEVEGVKYAHWVACDLRRVWVVLRMKDHMVSGMLRSRVQDVRTDSISDKAFEQVRLLPSIRA